MTGQTGQVVDGMARLLAAAGLGAYSPTEVLPDGQTPITVALTPAEPDQAITVTTYPGGPEPDSRNGYEYPRLQVRVRATNPLDALQLDRDTFVALQGAAGPLPATTWHLQDCYALQSDAESLSADTAGRLEYARNYQLSVEPAG